MLPTFEPLSVTLADIHYLHHLLWSPVPEDSSAAPLPDSAPPSGADWLTLIKSKKRPVRQHSFNRGMNKLQAVQQLIEEEIMQVSCFWLKGHRLKVQYKQGKSLCGGKSEVDSREHKQCTVKVSVMNKPRDFNTLLQYWPQMWQCFSFTNAVTNKAPLLLPLVPRICMFLTCSLSPAHFFFCWRPPVDSATAQSSHCLIPPEPTSASCSHAGDGSNVLCGNRSQRWFLSNNTESWPLETNDKDKHTGYPP